MKLKLICSAFLVFTISAAAEQDQSRPNILFIAVDDLRPELGCYGHPMVKSPHMDALAAGGLLFENAYCQTAVCMPSRVSVLSGLRPESFGFSGTFSPKVAAKATSLPQLFKNEGYSTVSIGKIYHANSDDPEGWTRRYEDTFGEWPKGYCSGYQLRSNQEVLENYFKKNSDANLPRPNSCERSNTPDEVHPDGIIALRAIEELRTFKKSGEPFFLATGFYRPHLPFTPPAKYWNLYDRDDIELSPNRDPIENGLTQYQWDELRRYGDIPVQGALSDEKAKELIHGYYASVSFVDAQIGKVMAELKRLELDKNTVVILWGDHGWQLGDHGWWCKHTSYEISARTSMMVSVPGKTYGTKTQALVELVDIYPSLCELADIPSPAHLEGRSFIPLIGNPNAAWKKAAFSEIKKIRGMRTRRYRLLRHKNGEFELFDHEKDPGENVNVANHPEYANVLNKLSAQMMAGPDANPKVSSHKNHFLDWINTDESVALTNNGKVVWKFNYDNKSTKPHFHPLALMDGTVLTENKPKDHPWHYGMWFSWKYLNRINYWEEDRKTGLPEGATSWSDVKVKTNKDHSATLSMVLKYQQNKQEPILSENRRIEISSPNSDGSYTMRWTSDFTACSDADVVFDRTPLPGEPDGKVFGGYAGLSVRLNGEGTQWSVNSEEKEVIFKDFKFREKANGMDFSGVFNKRAGGIAILDHPKNLNSPTPWYAILNPNQMKYFNASVICFEPYTLQAGTSFSLQYILIVHPEKWDKEMLRNQFEKYSLY